MPDITVREAGPADRPFLIECMAGLQVVECEMEPNRTAPDTAEVHLLSVLDEIEAHDGAALVALLDGVPAGFLLCSIDEDSGFYVKPEFRRFGYVHDIFVADAARGCGVAEALMEVAEAHCRAKGVNHMRLFMLAGNERARAFYERTGWAPYELSYRKPL